jgi:hypothetical protein
LTVVTISQSMYFPWLGHFELFRLADVYCHYDDVQLSRGFYNRVQVITDGVTELISVPLTKKKQRQLISQSLLQINDTWISKHRNKLRESLRKAPFFNCAIEIFNGVYNESHELLQNINRLSILKICDFLDLSRSTITSDSCGMHRNLSGSARLLAICKDLGADVYLTGHGGLNYLDHESFEKNGVEVHYIKYRFEQYEKLNSIYSPFVTSLDPIAYLGKEAKLTMQSEMIHWREALNNIDDLKAKATKRRS